MVIRAPDGANNEIYERRERENEKGEKICELTVGVFHLSSSKRDVVSRSFLQGITLEHEVTKLCKVFFSAHCFGTKAERDHECIEQLLEGCGVQLLPARHYI